MENKMERRNGRPNATGDNWRDRPFLDARDLSAWFPRVTVYKLLHSEGFPRVRIGKRLYVPTQAFLQWLDQQTIYTITDRK